MINIAWWTLPGSYHFLDLGRNEFVSSSSDPQNIAAIALLTFFAFAKSFLVFSHGVKRTAVSQQRKQVIRNTILTIDEMIEQAVALLLQNYSKNI